MKIITNQILYIVRLERSEEPIEGVPVEYEVDEELTTIIPNKENPLIYPDDYDFNTEFDIYTDNDETLLVNGTNSVFTIDEWGDYEDLNNFVWVPSNPQFGKYLILSTGQCPNDPNPDDPNVTPKPKLHSNTIHKLITIDDNVGKINETLTHNNIEYSIPLPQNKKFVDEVKVTVNVPPEEIPVVGNANITKSGQYLPNNFNHQTGELLPEGTYSNNQYLDQINVNIENNYNLSDFYLFASSYNSWPETGYSNYINNVISNKTFESNNWTKNETGSQLNWFDSLDTVVLHYDSVNHTITIYWWNCYGLALNSYCNTGDYYIRNQNSSEWTQGLYYKLGVSSFDLLAIEKLRNTTNHSCSVFSRIGDLIEM